MPDSMEILLKLNAARLWIALTRSQLSSLTSLLVLLRVTVVATMEIAQEVRDEGLEPGVAGTASPKAHIIINTLIFPSKLFYMILRMAGVDACIRGVDAT